MEPLSALTRRERIALLVASLLVALTRMLAISRSLWDWDEALFALAVRDFDVSAYHPQPPGFPLFIGAAKLLLFATGDEFRALQSITVAASLLLFPAMFFLARELRASTFAAFASATLLAFAPNVWFYGGTALSDVPSLLLSLVACTLLLRASHLGGVALGIAAAVRPQNLLIAAAPLLMLLLRHWRRFVVAMLIVAAIAGVSYGIAARESGGWSVYRATLAAHERYIRATDSFLAPSRPSLLRVADDFFVRPYRAPLINGALTLLAALALLARRRSALAALALFGPFCLFAWLYLDVHSAGRFSIAYAPLVALLAAEGIALLRGASAIVLAALTTLMIAWTVPALHTVRTTTSPPVAAMQHIRETTSARDTIVCFDERLGPHATLLLADYQRCAAFATPPALWATRARVVHVREDSGDVTFTRERTRLARLARDRYFTAGITPAQRITFVEGFGAEEGNVVAPYRSITAPRATILLPPAKRARLRMHLTGDAAFAIHLNGRMLTGEREFSIVVDGQPRNELRIETKGAGTLRLDRLEWAPLDSPSGTP